MGKMILNLWKNVAMFICGVKNLPIQHPENGST